MENLKEEVKKGMREKAEQGIYPGRAPIGYRNNSVSRAIDVDPERAPIVKRIFEFYASGNYSLTSLRKTVLAELGIRINRAYLETILKNRFYLGYFVWQGPEHKTQQRRNIANTTFLSDRLGGLLKDIHVPETVARTIVDSLQADSDRAEAARRQRIAEAQQRLAALRTRMDQMYEDKLDGKIDEEFLDAQDERLART